MVLKEFVFATSMVARDIGLFLTSARTDARLEALRRDGLAPRVVFDRLYAEAPPNDPWVSGSPRYHYQSLKYDALMDLLGESGFRRALDLGCGIGVLSERLAGLADEVLGVDISTVALGRIHRAFYWSPAWSLSGEHRRPFFLASLLSRGPHS